MRGHVVVHYFASFGDGDKVGKQDNKSELSLPFCMG